MKGVRSVSMEKRAITKETLWIVSERYCLEIVAGEQYLIRIAEALSDRYQVRVICGQSSFGSGDTTAPKLETNNGVEVFPVWSTLLNNNFVVYRVVNMLTLATTIFWRSLRKLRTGDKVLVTTAPPGLPFMTALASLINGASYNLLVHTYYPDRLVALRKLRPDSPLVKVMHLANCWLFKHAGRIIVLGNDMAEIVAARTHGLDVPISTISGWPEINDVLPVGRP